MALGVFFTLSGFLITAMLASEGSTERPDQPRLVLLTPGGPPGTPAAADRGALWPSTPRSSTWRRRRPASGGTAWRRCSTTPTTARRSVMRRSSVTSPRPGRSRWRSSSTSSGRSPWSSAWRCTGAACAYAFAMAGALASTGDRLYFVYHSPHFDARRLRPGVLRLRHPGGRRSSSDACSDSSPPTGYLHGWPRWARGLLTVAAAASALFLGWVLLYAPLDTENALRVVATAHDPRVDDHHRLPRGVSLEPRFQDRRARRAWSSSATSRTRSTSSTSPCTSPSSRTRPVGPTGRTNSPASG